MGLVWGVGPLGPVVLDHQRRGLVLKTYNRLAVLGRREEARFILNADSKVALDAKIEFEALCALNLFGLLRDAVIVVIFLELWQDDLAGEELVRDDDAGRRALGDGSGRHQALAAWILGLECGIDGARIIAAPYRLDVNAENVAAPGKGKRLGHQDGRVSRDALYRAHRGQAVLNRLDIGFEPVGNVVCRILKGLGHLGVLFQRLLDFISW